MDFGHTKASGQEDIRVGSRLGPQRGEEAVSEWRTGVGNDKDDERGCREMATSKAASPKGQAEML